MIWDPLRTYRTGVVPIKCNLGWKTNMDAYYIFSVEERKVEMRGEREKKTDWE